MFFDQGPIYLHLNAFYLSQWTSLSQEYSQSGRNSWVTFEINTFLTKNNYFRQMWFISWKIQWTTSSLWTCYKSFVKYFWLPVPCDLYLTGRNLDHEVAYLRFSLFSSWGSPDSRLKHLNISIWRNKQNLAKYNSLMTLEQDYDVNTFISGIFESLLCRKLWTEKLNGK